MADQEPTNALVTEGAQSVADPALAAMDANAPAADAIADGVVTDPAAADAPTDLNTSADAPKDDAPKPPKKPWWESRIAQTTWEKNEAKAKAKEFEDRAIIAEAALEAARRGDAPASDAAPSATPGLVLTQVQLEKRAEEIAEQKFRAKAFTDECNRTYEAGKREFQDFDAARDQLASNFGDVLQNRPDFLEAINAAPNGHKVFYELGKYPEEAARVLTLSPIRLAAELAVMGSKLGAPKTAPVSAAPKPIRPLSASSTVNEELSDDLPSDEWQRRREKHLAAKGKR